MVTIHLPSAILSILTVLIIVLLRIYIIHCLQILNGESPPVYMHKNAKKKMFYKDLEEHHLLFHKKGHFFYSHPSHWQFLYGHCPLYDDVAPFYDIILDQEPIPFEYNGKKWLIQLWKGQYGLSTGFEIGIFLSKESILHVKDNPYDCFYEHMKESSDFQIQATLYRNGNKLFYFHKIGTYINGYRPGVFSYPDELSLTTTLTFPNQSIAKAFIKGLLRAGYQPSEIHALETKVTFIFHRPYTTKPFTLTSLTTYLAQKNNEELCALFLYITARDKNYMEAFYTIKKVSPEFYQELLQIGRKKSLYSNDKTLKEHLSNYSKDFK
ncbi:MAG TPA: DUF4474 domain-containing protein [Candidatus Merdenecus merdavium]|nr:DUF4474 domain-containing protein [Candidatus Merdenecus merdavium]